MLTRVQLSQLIHKHSLDAYEARILDAVVPGINLYRQAISDENELALGASKLGGLPDLPKDFVLRSRYDAPSLLIAQFRLSEVAPYDQDEALPDQGMLYFFYDALYRSPEDKLPNGAYRHIPHVVYIDDDFYPEDNRVVSQVVYIPDERGSLIRRSNTSDSTSQDFVHPFNPCKLAFETTQCLPNPLDITVLPASYSIHDDGKTARDNEDRLWDDIERPDPAHWLLGAAESVQGLMEDQCEKVLNGWYPDELNNPDIPSFDERVQDWRLLLQIDYDDAVSSPPYSPTLGVMFADTGHMYFWIKRQDLVQRDFSRVVTIIQTC